MDRNWQLAEAHHRDGRHDTARALYARFGGEPAYAPWAHLRLSSLELAAGRVRDATHHALLAHRHAYDDPALRLLACRQLLGVGEVQAALESTQALASLSHVPMPLLAEAAKLLSDHMQPGAALALLSRLGVEANALGAGVDYLRGLNLVYHGELAAGAEALARSLALDPDFAPSYWSLAKLRVVEGRAGRIDHLRKRLREVGDGYAEGPLLLYSLFHELDADDAVEEAWPVLLRAMGARGRQVRYDEASQEAMCERVIALIPALARRAVEADEADRQSQPLFVAGMPRSGTTVIEQWLSRRYRLHSAGEPRDLARQMRWVTDQPGGPNPDLALVDAMASQDLGLLGERYLAHTRWMASGLPFYSDKWPENYQLLGFALAAMGRARAIIVRRGAMDTCWSNMKEWFGASYFYSYDALQTARQYGRFMRLTQAVGAAFGERVVIVDYERFVRNPESTGAGLARAVGLAPRDGEQSEAGVVATASAAQVRAGVSDRTVGAWQRYARWLGPLQEALQQDGWGERT